MNNGKDFYVHCCASQSDFVLITRRRHNMAAHGSHKQSQLLVYHGGFYLLPFPRNSIHGGLQEGPRVLLVSDK